MFAAVVFLGGCGATMQITPDKKSAISVVSISNHVVVTEKPQFISGAGRLLAPGIGGAIGGMIDSAERSKDQQYIAFLKSAEIDVGAIVRSVFEAQLKQDPFFGSRVRTTAPYQFVISVPFHALVQKTSLTNLYRANILIQVKLIGPTGKVISEGQAHSCLFGDCVPLHTLEEIQSNPAVLKEQYEAAARDAVRQLLKGL